MKKWILAAVAVLLAWNLWLSYRISQLNSQLAQQQASSAAGTTIVSNTVNGYTTDITETVRTAQAKVVTVALYTGEAQTAELSGLVYSSSSEGVYLVTNQGGIAEASRISVQFDSGSVMDAQLVGSDPQTDLALLVVHPEFDVTPFQLGDSDLLKQGEYAIAMGGRRNESQSGTVSFGVISMPRQMLRTASAEQLAWIADTLETDCAVNQTNTGGPLLNLSGEVVGMLSRNLSAGSSSSGMSYALSSNEIKLVAEQLKASGKVTRGYLGVIGRNVSDLTVYQKSALNVSLDNATGILVSYVEPGSPAEAAGLAVGDILLAMDNTEMQTVSQLRAALYSHAPDSEATLRYLRSGSSAEVKVTLK